MTDIPGKIAVFFDIDGTLVDGAGRMPDSTRNALKLLHEAGHMAFICTGRTRPHVNIPGQFDGIISGCGTCIEYNGREIFSYEIPKTLAVKTVGCFLQHGFKTVLEGSRFMYLDPDNFDIQPVLQSLKDSLGDKLLSIRENAPDWSFSKATCAVDSRITSGRERLACFEELCGDYEIMVHPPVEKADDFRVDMFEFVPRGFSKAEGIHRVCRYLGISPADTFAFGDSVNDIEMLQACGCGVVMGNASEAAKSYGDYITDSISEGGIYSALKHFRLI